MYIVASIIFCMFVLLLIWDGFHLTKLIRLSKGTYTQAVIKQIETKAAWRIRVGSRNHTHDLHISYVLAIEYGNKKCGIRQATAVCRNAYDLKCGDKIAVLYLPDSPETFILSDGADGIDSAFGSCIFGMLVMFAVICAFAPIVWDYLLILLSS